MKIKFLYSLIFSSLLLSSCYLLKISRDNTIIRNASLKKDKVFEAATIAVSLTYQSTQNRIIVSNILDSSIKNKLKAFGSTVEVAYQTGAYYEIPDSCVTFTTMTLIGVTDIIYDFAVRQRNFEPSKNKRKDYYFTKVVDRIYYRRRPIPLM